MNKMKPNEFCWNELATPNIKAAKDFYGELLGWKFTDHDMGEATYTMISSGDDNFAGIWEIPKDETNLIPPHWMSYILVDDLESTLEKAKKIGATMKVPVTQVGEMGRFAIISDPVGAPIAFWQTLSN